MHVRMLFLRTGCVLYYYLVHYIVYETLYAVDATVLLFLCCWYSRTLIRRVNWSVTNVHYAY